MDPNADIFEREGEGKFEGLFEAEFGFERGPRARHAAKRSPSSA
jgi:hypothetical protein